MHASLCMNTTDTPMLDSFHILACAYTTCNSMLCGADASSQHIHDSACHQRLV